jgi:glucose-1-phosphate thymidylyltransferase
MKVILPVAGVGKRLRPHTYSLPKVLLPVAGRPVLAYVLDPVVPLNAEEVVFVVGYKGEEVKRYVESHYSFKAKFVHQTELLGLGFALKLALDEIEDSPVLIVLGDTIVDCDLGQLVRSGDYVLGLQQVDDPARFGIAEVRNGFVVGLEEKPVNPKSNLALIGLYYFKESSVLRKALEDLVRSGRTTRGEIQLTDALDIMIQQGVKFGTYEVDGWYDCGKKETMLETNRILLDRGGTARSIEGSVLIPPVYVDDAAEIRSSVLGPHVSVSGGSVIENSIIRNSVIGSNTNIANVILSDSLVGNAVTLNGRRREVNIGDSSVIDIL